MEGVRVVVADMDPTMQNTIVEETKKYGGFGACLASHAERAG
jgi:hypothetical protein